MPTGNVNGYGMWGGGWGGMPYAPQQRPQMAMPPMSGQMPPQPFGAPQMPQMGAPMPYPQTGGQMPAYGAPPMGGPLPPGTFTAPEMPFQASPVAMNARLPGNDRESRMNRFGSFAQRFSL